MNYDQVYMSTISINYLKFASFNTVNLPHYSWKKCEKLLQNSRFSHILFFDGNLTLMTPLLEQKIINNLLSNMAKSLLKI
jgi:hypothetical protein